MGSDSSPRTGVACRLPSRNVGTGGQHYWRRHCPNGAVSPWRGYIIERRYHFPTPTVHLGRRIQQQWANHSSWGALPDASNDAGCMIPAVPMLCLTLRWLTVLKTSPAQSGHDKRSARFRWFHCGRLFANRWITQRGGCARYVWVVQQTAGGFGWGDIICRNYTQWKHRVQRSEGSWRESAAWIHHRKLAAL